MGRKRQQRGRDVHGIILLDKPLGMTSNAALQAVKRLFQARKAGHTGSLDPLASGLLPLCLGEATKMSSFLLDADKAYTGRCKLGVRTRSADAEGDIIETRPVPVLSEAQVKAMFSQFIGEIEQIPPMHSAIKHQGQPLYKLAHQGIEIERKSRLVNIYSLNLLTMRDDELEFELQCSKGTYVRTLAEDFGQELGCGAHLSALRRSQVGPFELDKSVTLEELQHVAADQGFAGLEQYLLPMDTALSHWPAVRLTDNSAYYVRQGQPVLVSQAPANGWVRLFAEQDDFIGVGQILDDGRVAPRRLVKTG